MTKKMDYKVYLHRNPNTGEVFYAGHGHHARAWATQRGRNQQWKKIYQEHGRTVEIVARYDDKELAAAHELLLIAQCRELGLPLVNRRSGGHDKTESLKHTEEAKANMRAAAAIRFKRHD